MAHPDPPLIDEAFEKTWKEKHPLGYVEHRQYWHPSGEFGAWVLGHNAVIKINDTLFLHGGIGPAYAQLSLQELNSRVRAELTNPRDYEERMVESEEGPLWYRGFSDAQGEEPPHLQALLEKHQVRRIVVGHTPGFGTIVPRLDSKVLVIDSGIADYYGGYQASLLIEGNEFFTVQSGEQIPLPSNDDEATAYLNRMAELDTKVDSLRALVKFREDAQAS